ncbi:MAG TPA: cohesin domain-containing protein [Bacteroidales bacterium]|nr:cohesin domain-containing protein [Bacteroidales bacterium]
MKKIILLFILIVTVLTSNSQTATIQTQTNILPGSNTTVDISISGFNPDDISGFQFTIRYDTTHLKYISTTDWFAGVTGVTVAQASYGNIRAISFAWAESFGLVIDGVLCKLNFLNKTTATGCQSIYWSDSPTSRVFIDGDYNEYTVTYVDGAVCSVCSPVSITGQPSDQSVDAGGSAVFSVSAGGSSPVTYQWRYYDGSVWNDVVNGIPAGAVYTGSATTTLNVSGISSAGSYLYRCYLTNCNGENDTATSTATLTVNAVCAPTAAIQTIQDAIPGSNVAVDVSLSCFAPDDLSGFQFTLRYDTTHLKYISTTNWFSGVTGVTVAQAGYGNIRAITFAWAESFGLVIDGVLCKLNFLNKTTATGCQSIYWSDNPTTRVFIDGDYNEYTVTYINGAVCSVCTPVSITGQPSDQSVDAGESAVFSVSAGGSSPVTYQWRYYDGSAWNDVVNGIPAGAVYTGNTTATLNVSGITGAGNYQYHCYLTNCNGENHTTTSAATLTVNAVCSATATIQTIQGAIPGSNVSVDVSLSCFAPDDLSGFQFSIQYDTTDLKYINTSDWFAGVTGVTIISSTYYGSLQSITFAWAESFGLVIDGVLCKLNFLNKTTATGCQSIYWSDNPTARVFIDGDYNEYTVSYVDGAVCSVCTPVSITGQPSDQSINTGDTAYFTVNAAGTPSYLYQWQYYNGNTWIDVVNDTPDGAIYSNSNTNTLMVGGITAAGSYQYRCVITNCGGINTVSSNAAALTVNASCFATATLQTVSGAIPGSNVAVDITTSCFAPDDIRGFQFTIQYDTTTLKYVSTTNWHSGISGVTVIASNYYGPFHAITYSWAESFGVVVDGALCRLNFMNKQNATGCQSVYWSDTPTPRMFINGDFEEYSVTYEDGAVCSVCTPVSISVQPSDQSISAGGSAFFSVSVNGTVPFTFQWQYLNGTSWNDVSDGIPAGSVYSNEAGSAMTVSGITATGSYQYRCLLTNCSGANNISSNPATLMVNALCPSVASIQTVSGAIPGSQIAVNISLSCFAPDNISGFQFTVKYDTTKLKYINSSDWYAGISGVTEVSSTYYGTVHALTFAWAESFAMVIDGVLCKLNFINKTNSTSCESIYWSDMPTPRTIINGDYNEYTVTYVDGGICTVCTGVNITVQPAGQHIGPGESAGFSVSADGSSPISYQWQLYNGNLWTNVNDGVPTGAVYSNSTSDSMTVSGVTAIGNYLYRCYVTNCSGGNVDTSNSATLKVDTISGPIATIQTVPGVIPGSTVAVNIVLSNFAPDDLAGFQFTIRYDTTNLKYINTTGWYPGISDVTQASPSYDGNIRLLSFLWGDMPVIIPNNGVLCKLNFLYKTSATDCESVYWSDNPTPRLFADGDYNEYLATYEDGGICPCIPLSINTAGQPIDQNICFGGNMTFEVGNEVPDELSGTLPFTYQWQYFEDSTWNIVTDGSPTGAIYAYADSNILSVSGNIPIGNYLYRCYLTNCEANNIAVSNSVTLTVNGPPPQIISGSTPLCMGSNTVWTSTTSGGNWSSSMPGIAVVSSSTGAVTGISAGTSEITYSVTSGNCTKTASETVVVTAPVPQTITGTSPLCEGSTEIWSSTTTGGTWSSSEPGVAEIDPTTGEVTCINAGTTVITYSVTIGGCINTVTKSLTITAPILQSIIGSTPLCINASAVWSGTIAGGTWTSSVPGVATVGLSTGQVTGVEAGTSLITYSVTVGGCVNTATRTVTVTAPVPQTIEGQTPLCIGSTTIWTSTTPEGAWTSAAPSVATADAVTGLITGVTAGTSIITYSITLGGCVNTATRAVVITAPVAQSIVGTTPLCTGSAANWTSTTTGGTWTSLSPGIASIGQSDGFLTGIEAGTSLITYSVELGGCVNTASRAVTITAPIAQTITGTTPLCTGSSSVWSGTTSGGTWSTSVPGVATIGSLSGNITGITAGTSLITYSVAVGGCINLATNLITVTAPIPQLISGTTPLCIGSVATWSSTTTGGTWTSSLPGIAAADASSGIISGISAGVSVISYSVEIGGCVNTATKTITITAPTPQTITGITPVCIGSSAVWTSTTAGGTWTSSNSGIATAESLTGSITGVSAGTSLVTYTVTTGVCINTATKTVTVTAPITQILTGTTPLCVGSHDLWSATTEGGIWVSAAPAVATVDIATGQVTGMAAGTTHITYSVTTGGCVNTATRSLTITAPIPQTITGNTPICTGSTAVWTSTTTGGNWASSLPNVATVDSLSGIVTGIGSGTSEISYSVTVGGCVNTAIKTVTITAPVVQIITGITPICSGSSVLWTSTSNGGTWTSSNPGVASVGSLTGQVTGISVGSSDITYTVLIGGCINIAVKTITVIAMPAAEAGADNIFTGTALPLGDSNNGPGMCSWYPATGLDNPDICQPLASPLTATTYILTVNNNGCITIDSVKISIGHTISGKTSYTGRANAGSPAPNYPTYNAPKYIIDNVIVILKSHPAGTEIARDTSDAAGNYQFNNILNGNYILSYDKFTPDTMQWGNDVNAIDVSLLKYFVGSDTNQDPSRCFSAIYKRAADVNNSKTINTIDIARIKTKIVSPYTTTYNLPKGNWPVIDTMINMSGEDMNVKLRTVCYGDYNASSSRYRDSLITWVGLKSLKDDFIVTSGELITTNDPYYFEIPLKISSKMNDFSALGLEITYPYDQYRLETVYVPKAVNKTGIIKINPSYEEIIAEDNDLLVTDEKGVIRVLYATTNHFDLAAADDLIIMGFHKLFGQKSGNIDFLLSGTGVIGNQYGDENEGIYLLMPKVFVQGDYVETGLSFTAFPNPFNEKADINYTLPENGMVKLCVYNVLGELVSILVDENQQIGKHSVVFAAKNYPAGMYTFKLEFTGLKESKCQILKLVH